MMVIIVPSVLTTPLPNGTRLTVEVEYTLPWGPVGRLLDPILRPRHLPGTPSGAARVAREVVGGATTRIGA
jgi:hypothetical protein